MDINALTELFATTLSEDPNSRIRAELQLRKIMNQEGLLPALMQIIASDGSPAVHQACVVFLKNRISKCYWIEKTRVRADEAAITQADKQALKDNFLQLIIAAPSKNARLHLAVALNKMIAHDFPERWPGLLGNVQRLLSSSDWREMIAGCIALLEMIKSFRYRQAGASILAKVIEATFPAIVEVGLKLMNAASAGVSGGTSAEQLTQEIPYLLHLILKAYKSTLVLHLSAHQKTSGSIVPWGRLLFAVINFQVPKEILPEGEDEREKSEWWKAKKWAYGTLDRLFHRYGNPSQLPSTMRTDYGQFAEHFISAFAPEIIKTYLHQIEMFITGQSWLSRKCQYLVFQFFSECIKPKATWLLLKPHAETLVGKFVFPQLSFTSAKHELWNSDPVEYVRTALDEYEDYNSPVSSATTFLVTLAKTRAKTTFLPILNLINQVLDGQPNPAQKFGALNMTTALAPFIMGNASVKPAMEQFIIRHVIPELSSPEPYLRAIACETACTLVKFNVEWSGDANLLLLFNGVVGRMDDSELPVRVHAAMALTEMVRRHRIVAEAVGPMVGKVIQDLLKLSDETDLDILNVLMEVMVEQYSTELLPVATQLTARLCETYTRLVQEANAAMADESDPNVVEEDRTPDDDKTFAAMGVAKTIGTIIASVDANPEILNELQQVIIPIISLTLETKAIDLYDNVYDLVDSLTFNTRSIAPQMWHVFEQTYALFKTDAIDFLDEMLPALDNFLSYGKDVFISRPDYVEKVLDIYVTAITSDQLGENDRRSGSQLAESMLLNLRGHIDQALPTIITTAFKILDPEPETKALKLANLEVLINSVLYNAPATLHIMESQSPEKLQILFKQWFELLQEDLYLPRVHDKKLSILAMCALLTVEASQVPPSLHDGWIGIVNGILMVFKSLPAAVADRNKLIEKANESDESDEEGDLDNLSVADVGDEDVWDKESQYIEMLAKEGARLRAREQARTTETGLPVGEFEEDDEDESDDDSDDDMKEDLGYISPLENIDPYVTFKHALQGFQEKNPALYQASTNVPALNMETQAVLMEVMALAERAESS